MFLKLDKRVRCLLGLDDRDFKQQWPVVVTQVHI